MIQYGHMAVEFEDQYRFRPSMNARPIGIVGFLLRHKIAKNEAQANKILVIVGIFIIVVSVILFVIAYTNANVKESIYNFPDELIGRFPPDLQEKILNVIHAAKK